MTVILHVCQPTDGGVPNVVAQHLEAAVARGWTAHLACPAGVAADLGRRAGAHVHGWQAVRSPSPHHLRAEARDLGSVIDEVGPDVVVLHSAKAGLVGRLVLRGAVPTVFMPHAWSWQAVGGAHQSVARAWERVAARWTHLFGCVCTAEVEAGRGAGVRGDFLVCANDVAAPEIRALAPASRRAARRQVEVDLDARLVVCVARLAPQKDHATLLRAWSQVSDRVPGAELVLVGDGPQRAELTRLAEALPGLRLAGALPRERAMAWLKAANVVVCSSRFEGRALVPQEAAALGRVVVTTDVAGVDEGYCGPGRVVVAVGDDHELGRQVTDLLVDDARLSSAEAELAVELAPNKSDTPRGAIRLLNRCADLVGQPRLVGSSA